MTEFVYRREDAVNKMLEVIDMLHRIKKINREINGLVFIGETLNPERVNGLSMDKILGDLSVETYIGHRLTYGLAEISLYTENGVNPSDSVFYRTHNEYIEKKNLGVK